MLWKGRVGEGKDGSALCREGSGDGWEAHAVERDVTDLGGGREGGSGKGVMVAVDGEQEKTSRDREQQGCYQYGPWDGHVLVSRIELRRRVCPMGDDSVTFTAKQKSLGLPH